MARTRVLISPCANVNLRATQVSDGAMWDLKPRLQGLGERWLRLVERCHAASAPARVNWEWEHWSWSLGKEGPAALAFLNPVVAARGPFRLDDGGGCRAARPGPRRE